MGTPGPGRSRLFQAAALLAACLLAAVLMDRFKPEPPRAETPSGTLWLLKGLTYCDEPWNRAPHRSPDAFLKANGVEALAAAVTDGGGGQECRSCDCRSGTELNILVRDADADRARALGFTPAQKPPSAEQAAAGWPR